MFMHILKALNDNHWYIIATVVIAVAIFWTYGCESQVKSLIEPNKMVNRTELDNELQYLLGKAQALAERLDKQDEIKQALLDAASVIGTTGQINPTGLLNLAATIGGISFGLSQRQKYKGAIAKNTSPPA